MSNYRRLISYLYAYEGGIKGKNIGFAKLESRGGQCKIQVSVRKIYIGGQDTGVYLLSGSEEIYLGKIFLRNGAGEFRAWVNAANVAGSGLSMDQCYGLTLHSLEDSWQSYTTIWEDAVARAAEVDLKDVDAEAAQKKEMEELPKPQITEQELVGITANHKSSIVEMIEAEIQALPQAPAETPEPLPPELSAPQPALTPAEPEIPQPAPTPAEPEILQPAPTPPGPESPQPEIQTPQPAPEIPGREEPPKPERPEPTQPEPTPVEPQRLEPEGPVPVPDVQLPDVETRGETEKLWQYFKRTYAKIQAFDYNGTCEILTIQPQDIGLLPRETWGYGNNSFLLHGYYSHRYLILARLKGSKGKDRFLLGVPGHYYSSEKYMASMFGFPNFVLSKMQPAGDGRFGYWYTDLRLHVQ